MTTLITPSRRSLLATALSLLALPSAATAASRTLTFSVARNGVRIGTHVLTLSGGDADLTARSDVDMTVRLGPVPVFRYRHRAAERWTGGRFSSLETTTTANGKTLRLAAEASAAGVAIEGASGKTRGPAGSAPLTHWNPGSFAGPVFDPQSGKLLKVRATRVAPAHWAIRGEVEIDDFYDADGAWLALRGKLEDGSRITYRRV